jgi:PadR family transcriptional regulator AphA
MANPSARRASIGRAEPSPPAERERPSLAELVCLCLVAEDGCHGWAIGTVLAPDGELGRVWTLSRPLTYRAIDQLEAKGLLRRRITRGQGAARGVGGSRTPLAATAKGRALAARWLDEPVEHVRDVRTELLLKLLLRRRRGLALEPLLEGQRRAFTPQLDALIDTTPDGDVVALWRRESARAVRRFLDAACAGAGANGPHERVMMPLSARNQLRATVTEIRRGDALSSVQSVLGDGQRITAVVTTDAVDDLDLAEGDAVLAVVKSTEVMLAKSACADPSG